MRIVLLAALLIASSGTARAELAPKDEDTALYLSLGGTAAAVAAVGVGAAINNDSDAGPFLILGGLAGTMVAPSLGHFYAGRIWSRGLGLRLLGLSALVVGAGVSLGRACHGCPEGEEEGSSLGLVAVVGGLVSYLVGIGDDVIQAPQEARRYNQRFQVSVVPKLDRGGGGLAIVGRF